MSGRVIEDNVEDDNDVWDRWQIFFLWPLTKNGRLEDAIHPEIACSNPIHFICFSLFTQKINLVFFLQLLSGPCHKGNRLQSITTSETRI